ncbi:hypothetical protein L5F43_09995 [Aliarcobacter butzleri]|uniref:Uncharacterized protein n=2 Tax=Aliarcobacter butzleri TaxID=28197 RepID=A0AAW7Q092_9BACT|nr:MULTISPECIES: hypothetical protein [Arcobacteraceae]KLD98478.1 hypothetical protein AA20_08645 [Aliarcobacter butzleri L348]MCG3655462.1 hypothetical protein [Aliarcobacter butzleri]MCG3684321.1 hypothetical protein [Aliarcobacter butzleri]MCG3686455.1 hypothetical protein [Aliarcobacter butzleri]MCG3688453.1 hypothetical protein [Aliarcobacter butzleri]
MKKADWLMFITIIFFVAVITVFTTIFIMDKYFIPQIKTVSMMQVLSDEKDDSYQKFLDGKLTQEEYTKTVENKMLKIQEALDYYTKNGKDILLVEEAVIKTNNNNFTSLTETIKNHVK